jgi:hypothetical protein
MAFDERLAEVVAQENYTVRAKSAAPETQDRQKDQATDLIEDRQTERSDTTEDQKNSEQWRHLETEMNQYKLRAATCLEQLAWFKVIKAADDEEMKRLRESTADLIEESVRLQAVIKDNESVQARLNDDLEKETAIRINDLERELALAQLRIDELTADLAYFGDSRDDRDIR